MKLKLIIACILWLFVAMYTAYDAHKKKETQLDRTKFEVAVKSTF